MTFRRWIRRNVFNLFGLIPYDPTHVAAFLHLSAWTLIMGFTMYMQQQLNPPPPDPMQARLFKFMPLIFMFMMGNFPGRAADLLELEQYSYDRATMVDHASDEDRPGLDAGDPVTPEAAAGEELEPRGGAGCCSPPRASFSSPPNGWISFRRPGGRRLRLPAGPMSASRR